MHNNRSTHKPLNNLRFIDEVSPLDESDRSCLDNIKKELAASGQTKRFGINLLHKHFDLRDGEVLIERADPDQRRIIASVERRSEKTKLVAKMWKFT